MFELQQCFSFAPVIQEVCATRQGARLVAEWPTLCRLKCLQLTSCRLNLRLRTTAPIELGKFSVVGLMRSATVATAKVQVVDKVVAHGACEGSVTQLLAAPPEATEGQRRHVRWRDVLFLAGLRLVRQASAAHASSACKQ